MILKLATTTGILSHKQDGGYISYIEALQRLRAAGFTALDLNFCSAINGKSDLAADDWEERIYMLGEEAARSGVEFVQSHPVFLTVNIHEKPPELQDLFHRMMSRSLMASSILGVKWAVLHPGSVSHDDKVDIKENIKINMENFDFAVELATKLKVGIAFENLPLRPLLPGRFSSTAEHMVELVDEYSDPNIGVCWDFGHGNIAYDDQRPALRQIGKRLKATHVADNHGTGDDHMLPYHGTTNWKDIMPVLKEIGYEGAFALETGMETKFMPDRLKDDMTRIAYKVGKYCLSLAE